MAYDYSDFDEQPSMSNAHAQRLYDRSNSGTPNRSDEFAVGTTTHHRNDAHFGVAGSVEGPDADYEKRYTQSDWQTLDSDW